jgi:hypothetical protein
VIIIRYADDMILGFQHKAEAERFVAALRQRLEQHGLSLHPDKTRLVQVRDTVRAIVAVGRCGALARTCLGTCQTRLMRCSPRSGRRAGIAAH